MLSLCQQIAIHVRTLVVIIVIAVINTAPSSWKQLTVVSPHVAEVGDRVGRRNGSWPVPKAKRR